MSEEFWHAEFNPKKFLGRVSIEKLIERNEAYNENIVTNERSPCVMCARATGRGILLNDHSFLCQSCYSVVAMISYPERYEGIRREYVVAKEARRLAMEGFKTQFEYRSQESSLVFFGWASLLLLFINPAFLLVTGVLLAIGYTKNSANSRKTAEWLCRKAAWESSNPEPHEPALKHFHDPTAILTDRDRVVLRVFDHWPGYPPFWGYLRAIVLGKDSNRCQVSGCPSRLGLHVHHMRPVASGGSHAPDNLVSLCDFHHALEPDKGHERIWADIRTRYFTLVCGHERSNRACEGTHQVRAHLRRLQLVTLPELRQVCVTYGMCCPSCGNSEVQFSVIEDKNLVRAACSSCGKSTEGPQRLTEETGPMLAEILSVSRNNGRWKARWDMLAERKSGTWGVWSGPAVAAKRHAHKEKVEKEEAAPQCPKCGSAMRLINPRPWDKWNSFWGCTQYKVSGCRGKGKFQGARKRAGS